MIVLMVFLLLWQALTLRPTRNALPTVDANAKAVQVATDTKWQVSLPKPGSEWRATSATMEPVRGAATFTAGYHRSPDDLQFVAVSQSVPDSDAASAWVADLTRNGAPSGTRQIGGVTWKQYTSPGDPVRNSIVREGKAGVPTVILAGNVDNDELARFAQTLTVVPPRS